MSLRSRRTRMVTEKWRILDRKGLIRLLGNSRKTMKNVVCVKVVSYHDIVFLANSANNIQTRRPKDEMGPPNEIVGALVLPSIDFWSPQWVPPVGLNATWLFFPQKTLKINCKSFVFLGQGDQQSQCRYFKLFPASIGIVLVEIRSKRCFSIG